MSSSFQSGYQDQNSPPVQQSPSSIPPNQQQFGQGHGPGYGPGQGQADGRPRIYNPSFSQYSQNNTTTNEMWNSIREASSRNYGKRNRIMIGLVVAVFLLMVTHQSNAGRKSKHQSELGKESVEPLVKVVKEEEHAKDIKEKVTTKGVAGDKPVPIPDRPVDTTPKIPNAKAKTKDADDAPSNQSSPPTLTYLLTYPQSGAGYTVELFEVATNVNTATNYEANIRKSSTTSLMLTEANASPYWHTTDQNYTKPQNRILTLTHCDGYRTSDTAVIPDYIFEQGCRTVRDKRNVNPKVLPRQYWDPAKRTIHLIRDPFSNVVSQSHLYRYTHAADTSIGRYFPFHSELELDKAEFRNYCGQIDKMDLTGFKIELNEEMAAILEKVPCGLDFMKYVQWHMLANKMNQRSASVKFGERGIDNIGAAFSYPEESSDSLVIYSEAFQSEAKTNEVLAMVTVFLGLENVDFTKRPGFNSARIYKHYYTEEERKAVEQLFRVMLAHDVETWNLLKHYFD